MKFSELCIRSYPKVRVDQVDQSEPILMD